MKITIEVENKPAQSFEVLDGCMTIITDDVRHFTAPVTDNTRFPAGFDSLDTDTQKQERIDTLAEYVAVVLGGPDVYV